MKTKRLSALLAALSVATITGGSLNSNIAYASEITSINEQGIVNDNNGVKSKAKKSKELSIDLTTDRKNYKVGEDVHLDMMFNNRGARNIESITIQYDPEKLCLVNRELNDGEEYFDRDLADNKDGKLYFYLKNDNVEKLNELLGTIHFKTISEGDTSVKVISAYSSGVDDDGIGINDTLPETEIKLNISKEEDTKQENIKKDDNTKVEDTKQEDIKKDDTQIEDASINLTTDSKNVKVGDEVHLDMMFNNRGKLNRERIVIEYDPEKLSLLFSKLNDGEKYFDRDELDNVNGKLYFYLENDNAEELNELLGTLHFKAISEGETSVKVRRASASGVDANGYAISDTLPDTEAKINIAKEEDAKYQDAFVSFETERDNIRVGDRVHLDMMFNNREIFKNEEMTIDYDPKMLKYIGTNLNINENLIVNEIDEENGKLHLIINTDKETDLREFLGTLDFEALMPGFPNVKIIECIAHGTDADGAGITRCLPTKDIAFITNERTSYADKDANINLTTDNKTVKVNNDVHLDMMFDKKEISDNKNNESNKNVKIDCVIEYNPEKLMYVDTILNSNANHNLVINYNDSNLGRVSVTVVASREADICNLLGTLKFKAVAKNDGSSTLRLVDAFMSEYGNINEDYNYNEGINITTHSLPNSEITLNIVQNY